MDEEGSGAGGHDCLVVSATTPHCSPPLDPSSPHLSPLELPAPSAPGHVVGLGRLGLRPQRAGLRSADDALDRKPTASAATPAATRGRPPLAAVLARLSRNKYTFYG